MNMKNKSGSFPGKSESTSPATPRMLIQPYKPAIEFAPYPDPSLPRQKSSGSKKKSGAIPSEDFTLKCKHNSEIETEKDGLFSKFRNTFSGFIVNIKETVSSIFKIKDEDESSILPSKVRERETIQSLHKAKLEDHPINKLDFSPLGRVLHSEINAPTLEGVNRVNIPKQQGSNGSHGNLNNSINNDYLNQSNLLNQSHGGEIRFPLNNSILNNSIQSRGCNLELSEQLDKVLPNSKRDKRIRRKEKINLMRILNNCHLQYENKVQKYSQSCTGAFNRNLKVLLTENLPRPIPLRTPQPTIEFKWNKVIDKFEAIRLYKKRKGMDIEVNDQSKNRGVLANSTLEMEREKTLIRPDLKKTKKTIISPQSSGIHTTNIVVDLRGTSQKAITILNKQQQKKKNYLLKSFDEIEEDEEFGYKKKSPATNLIFEEDKNCSKSTDTDSEGVAFHQRRENSPDLSEKFLQKKVTLETACQTSPIRSPNLQSTSKGASPNLLQSKDSSEKKPFQTNLFGSTQEEQKTSQASVIVEKMTQETETKNPSLFSQSQNMNPDTSPKLDLNKNNNLFMKKEETTTSATQENKPVLFSNLKSPTFNQPSSNNNLFAKKEEPTKLDLQESTPSTVDKVDPTPQKIEVNKKPSPKLSLTQLTQNEDNQITETQKVEQNETNNSVLPTQITPQSTDSTEVKPSVISQDVNEILMNYKKKMTAPSENKDQVSNNPFLNLAKRTSSDGLMNSMNNNQTNQPSTNTNDNPPVENKNPFQLKKESSTPGLLGLIRGFSSAENPPASNQPTVSNNNPMTNSTNIEQPVTNLFRNNSAGPNLFNKPTPSNQGPSNTQNNLFSNMAGPTNNLNTNNSTNNLDANLVNNLGMNNTSNNLTNNLFQKNPTPISTQNVIPQNNNTGMSGMEIIEKENSMGIQNNGPSLFSNLNNNNNNLNNLNSANNLNRMNSSNNLFSGNLNQNNTNNLFSGNNANKLNPMFNQGPPNPLFGPAPTNNSNNNNLFPMNTQPNTQLFSNTSSINSNLFGSSNNAQNQTQNLFMGGTQGSMNQSNNNLFNTPMQNQNNNGGFKGIAATSSVGGMGAGNNLFPFGGNNNNNNNINNMMGGFDPNKSLEAANKFFGNPSQNNNDQNARVIRKIVVPIGSGKPKERAF